MWGPINIADYFSQALTSIDQLDRCDQVASITFIWQSNRPECLNGLGVGSFLAGKEDSLAGNGNTFQVVLHVGWSPSFLFRSPKRMGLATDSLSNKPRNLGGKLPIGTSESPI